MSQTVQAESQTTNPPVTNLPVTDGSLRSSSILPRESDLNPMLEEAAGDVRSARITPGEAIAGSDVSGALDAVRRARGFADAADPTSDAARRVRELTLRGVEGLQGPDRSALAQRTFDLLRERTEPAFQRELQDVGRRAATLGRIGSGVTTSDLGDVQSQRERFLSEAQRDLALDTAGRSLEDRLGIVGAQAGIGRGFAAEDLGRAGHDLSRAGGERALASYLEGLQRRSRGELVGERDYRTNVDLQNARLGLERAGMLSGIRGQQFGEGQATRNEFRTERDYQNYLEQRAFNRARGKMLDEDMLLNSATNRDLSRIGMAANLGFRDPSYDAYLREALRVGAT